MYRPVQTQASLPISQKCHQLDSTWRPTQVVSVVSLLVVTLLAVIAVLVAAHFRNRSPVHIPIRPPGASVKGVVSFDDGNRGAGDNRKDEIKRHTNYFMGKNEIGTPTVSVVSDFETSNTSQSDQLSVQKGDQVFMTKKHNQLTYAYTSEKKDWVPDWELQPRANHHDHLRGVAKIIEKVR